MWHNHFHVHFNSSLFLPPLLLPYSSKFNSLDFLLSSIFLSSPLTKKNVKKKTKKLCPVFINNKRHKQNYTDFSFTSFTFIPFLSHFWDWCDTIRYVWYVCMYDMYVCVIRKPLSQVESLNQRDACFSLPSRSDQEMMKYEQFTSKRR